MRELSPRYVLFTRVAPLLGGLLLGALATWLWLRPPSDAGQRRRSVARIGAHTLPRADYVAAVARESKALKVDVADVPLARREAAMQALVDEELLLQEALRNGAARDDNTRWRIATEYVNNTVNRQIDPRSYTDADRRRYYDAHPEKFIRKKEWRAHEILLLAPSGEPAESPEVAAVEKRAQALAETLRAFPDRLAELYEQNHQGPRDPAAPTGEMGWVPEDLPMSEIRDALANANAGDVVVARTMFGYHVIYCAERHGGELMPFEDARGKALFEIVNDRHQELRKKLIDELRARAGVQYNGAALGVKP